LPFLRIDTYVTVTDVLKQNYSPIISPIQCTMWLYIVLLIRSGNKTQQKHFSTVIATLFHSFSRASACTELARAGF
jgi:hypothetical protein